MGCCTNPDSYAVAFYKSESLSPGFNTLEVPFTVFKTAGFPICFLFMNYGKLFSMLRVWSYNIS